MQVQKMKLQRVQVRDISKKKKNSKEYKFVIFPLTPLCLSEKRKFTKYVYVQPIADRVAKNLEIISETFSTDQNSAHGIFD